jgi:hypothetical protein
MSDTLDPTVERLRATFHAVAGQVDEVAPDLDPALRHAVDLAAPTDETTEVDTVVDVHPQSPGVTSNRRWIAAATAFVAAVLLVAGIVLVRQARGGDVGTDPATEDPTPTPVGPPTDTTDLLLPEGAPSLPPTGELAAAINIRHRGVYRLYADGRLIRVWSIGPLSPERMAVIGPDDVEGPDVRRLTPDGVDRVRAIFLSSGLFEGAESLSGPDCPAVYACVRDGDRWLGVQVDVGGPSPSLAPLEARRLFIALDGLDSKIPSTAWIDPQITPYVPARVGTCLSLVVDGTPTPIDLPDVASRFPAGAASVLAAHERSTAMDDLLLPLTRFDAGRFDQVMLPDSGCVELTLDEARAVAAALLDPSVGATPAEGMSLTFVPQLDPSDSGATSETGQVWFFSLLPDTLPLDAFGD